MKSAIARTALIPSLLLATCASFAQAPQPNEQIRATAERFVTQKLSSAGTGTIIHATAGELDARLNLANCQVPLIAALPQSARLAARMTIGVSCGQPRWTIYVPVSIETELSVLVLREARTRGSEVTVADVETQVLQVPGLADTYIREPAQLAGRHLKASAAPGTPLSVDLLAANILVKRGQRVTLVAQAGGLEVRAEGEAVNDANAAGRVRVLNLASRRIVEGQVESSSLVRVSL